MGKLPSPTGTVNIPGDDCKARSMPLAGLSGIKEAISKKYPGGNWVPCIVREEHVGYCYPIGKVKDEGDSSEDQGDLQAFVITLIWNTNPPMIHVASELMVVITIMDFEE